MAISIIIPVLNEAEGITSLLGYLAENMHSRENTELIIVDGGSLDGTQDLVRSFINGNPSLQLKLINSERGRARQMNLGVKESKYEVLYFLHADSYPPRHFDALILEQIALKNQAGCFRLQFDDDHWWLKLAGWFTKFNWMACRGGDQSLFISKGLFESLGGYNEAYHIYEDNMLIRDLYKAKHFVVMPQAITTSARLYRQCGIWQLQYHFWVIHLKKWLGASPESLHSYYQKKILRAG
ncbi:MAG: TIGR04283 family arsenosugar biosynthesis glycosyltransferase [Gilvibacter sp.]